MQFKIDKEGWPKDSVFKAPDYKVYYVQCQECAHRSERGDVLNARECPRCGGLMTPRSGYKWLTGNKKKMEALR